MKKYIHIVITFLLVQLSFAQDITIQSDTVCFGSPTSLTIKNPNPALQYLWDLDNDGFYDDATGSSVSYLFPKQGNNEFKILTKNGLNETWTSNEQIAFTLQNPTISLLNNSSCQHIILQETNNDFDLINWSINDNPLSFHSNTLDTTLTPGDYQIKIQVTKNNCQAQFIQPIQLQQLTTPDITAPQSACQNDTLSFLVNNNTLYDQLLWKFSNQTQLINQGKILFDTTGLISYELIYKQKNTSCKNTLKGQFTIHQNPSFELKTTQTKFIKGQDVEIYPSTQFLNPTWNNNSQNFNLTVQESGTYSLTQQNEFACQFTNNMTILFIESIPFFEIVNEIITPVEDDVNDFFIINKNQDFDYPIQVKIYARNGQEVFHSANYQNDWNGKFDGKTLPSDSYYYEITYQNEILHGTLHIIY